MVIYYKNWRLNLLKGVKCNNIMDINNILIEKCNNNIEIIEIFSYNDIFMNKNMIKPIKYKILEKNKIDKNSFQNELLNYKLDWSIKGKSDIIIGNILYKDFLNNIENQTNENKYIFHNILENEELFNVVKKYIPLPHMDKTEKIRISRFYSGYKYSGSNIHNHTKALNYLISGMKLWILFPNTKNNIDFLEKNKLSYHLNDNIPLNSFLENYNILNKYIENICIIIQEENEVIYIPDYYFHGIINLSDCYGITYSFMYFPTLAFRKITDNLR